MASFEFAYLLASLSCLLHIVAIALTKFSNRKIVHQIGVGLEILSLIGLLVSYSLLSYCYAAKLGHFLALRPPSPIP